MSIYLYEKYFSKLVSIENFETFHNLSRIKFKLSTISWCGKAVIDNLTFYCRLNSKKSDASVSVLKPFLIAQTDWNFTFLFFPWSLMILYLASILLKYYVFIKNYTTKRFLVLSNKKINEDELFWSIDFEFRSKSIMIIGYTKNSSYTVIHSNTKFRTLKIIQRILALQQQSRIFTFQRKTFNFSFRAHYASTALISISLALSLGRGHVRVLL